MREQETIRIGAGAGYAGDRIEPAIELAEKGNLDYLVFECLAERTIALAQQEKRRDATRGYDPMLAERMQAVLPACAAQGITIITNAGAANPVAAAMKVREVARSMGLTGLTLAAITGDDVLEGLDWEKGRVQETGESLASIQDRVISANAYLGAEAMVEALAHGADVIIAGRVADPALFLAPMIHAFGWAADDWTRLGQGTVAGHLLECAGQVTGGYFADPGFKDIPDLAWLGFPIGEVRADGSVVITKVDGSGGRVSEATCKEQLLYEIHDPARYLTPDVVADFSEVTIEEVGPDRVQVVGGKGHPRPDTLKVSVGYQDGYIGEGQISYAGPGATARARLALDVVAERFRLMNLACRETRFECIGLDALHGPGRSRAAAEPYEVRARVVGRTANEAAARRIGNEVEALYTNGPAGGGGVTKQVREVLRVVSTELPRTRVTTAIQYLET